MTTADVIARVDEIRAFAGDAEKAHGMEDRLYLEVLAEIAEGEGRAADLARAAIRASDIEFERWCA